MQKQMLNLGKESRILISREQQWTIPKGTEFYATQKPKHKNLTLFVAEDDLKVIYAGELMRLEMEATETAFVVARQEKKITAFLTILGLIFFLILKRKIFKPRKP